MRHRHLLIACVAAVSAMIGGSAAGAAAATPVSSLTITTVLTAADNGRTVTAHVGDVVKVVLPPVQWSWTTPVASDPKILMFLPLPVPFNSGQSFFRASTTGTATLSSTKSCHITGQAGVCPMIVQLWTATVHVV